MIILESTTVIASTLDGTTFLSMPVTKNRGIEISPYQRTLIHDDKFIVVLSVTVVSSVIILLTLVLTKLRCKTNNDIIYNTNGRRHHTSLDQSQVPFRNFETNVYMEFEEISELKEISNTRFEKLQNSKSGVIKGISSDNFSKSNQNRARLKRNKICRKKKLKI